MKYKCIIKIYGIKNFQKLSTSTVSSSICGVTPMKFLNYVYLQDNAVARQTTGTALFLASSRRGSGMCAF